MHAFDRDIHTTPVAAPAGSPPGTLAFAGQVDPAWNIGTNPNGGYLLALAAAALRQALPEQPDCLSVTVHFLRPGLAGQPCRVDVQVLRTGRSLSTARATLWQEGGARLEVMAAMGHLGDADSAPAPLVTLPCPTLPPPEACPNRSAPAQGVSLPILDRLDIRLHPDHAQPGATGQAEVSGWIRFGDGRAPDALACLLMVDAFPPAVFGLLGQVGWVPTIELTVHLRRRPVPGWLQGRFATHDLSDGRLIEDGALWDASGQLVAQSRQLALVRQATAPAQTGSAATATATATAPATAPATTPQPPLAASKRADMLVSPAWLQDHLHDPDLRIIDCSAQLVIQPVGASRVESGLPAYQQAHIPGARYINMATDLSDPQGRYPYTFPPDGQIEALLGSLGIAPHHRVVLYGHGYLGSITRVWYVLHAAGHQRLALLDGGFERWQQEGRPVTSALPEIQPEAYRVQRRPGLVADADQVLAALAGGQTCVVNALSREQFLGTGGTHYGRPGSIAGSTSAPARDMLDAATNRLLPDDQLRAQLAQAGVWQQPRAISYCGGGIAASITAFVLEMLGHPNWALYDNSLLEWAKQPELPMHSQGQGGAG